MALRKRLTVLALLIISAATLVALGCDAPEKRIGPRLVPSSRYSIDPDSTPLAVYLGWTPVTNNSRSYTATVTGGSGVYSYRWYKRACPGNVADYDCSDEYDLVADTGQTVTLTVPHWTSGTKAHVAVEVKEANVDGRSGADSSAWIIRADNGTYPTTSYLCPMGTLGYQFPFEKWVYNPDSARFVKTDSTYRRNPCTGAKEFK
jgi:hypothetical protein